MISRKPGHQGSGRERGAAAWNQKVGGSNPPRSAVARPSRFPREGVPGLGTRLWWVNALSEPTHQFSCSFLATGRREMLWRHVAADQQVLAIGHPGHGGVRSAWHMRGVQPDHCVGPPSSTPCLRTPLGLGSRRCCPSPCLCEAVLLLDVLSW